MLYNNKKQKNFMVIEEELYNLKTYSKPRLLENIPVLGTVTYAIRMQKKDYNVKNNDLHKSLMHYRIKFMIYGLVIGFIVLLLLTPWILYLVHSLAIKKSAKKLLELK